MPSSRTSLTRFALVLASFVAAATAQVITVGPAGSGADYETIPEGIAAAPPGGVVLVAAGDYAGNATLRIDKPLTLLGAGSATTRYRALPGGLLLPRLPLLVTDLQPGEQVVVGGLELIAQAGNGLAASIAVVQDCVGPVLLSDLRGAGATMLFPEAGVVQVRDSVMVTLEGCWLASSTSNDLQPTAALRVERSLVHVNACQLYGGSAPAAFNHPGHDGAPGIVAIDAAVRLSRSLVRGGLGAQTQFLSTPNLETSGGDAVRALGSQIFVRGGAGNELTGGKGGNGSIGGQPLSGPGGAALHLDAASVGSLAPDVVANAGPDGDWQLNTPAIDGPGAFAPLPLSLVTLAATPLLAAPGSTVDFAVGGEAGSLCVGFLSTALQTGFSLPGVFGVVTIDPTSLVSLPLLVLDANGVGAFAVGLPASPSLVGIVAHTQELAFGPSGWISLSAPSSFAIR